MPANSHDIGLGRAMLRSLLDSSDVEALLRLEELTSTRGMAATLARVRHSDEGQRLLNERPALNSSTVDLTALGAMPANTLGYAYARHLRENGLDLDALSVPVTASDDPDRNWMLERIRQTHDIWHTMLGRSTEPHQEVLVHAFQWGQMNMPYSWLVVVFGVLKHFVGERRWRLLRKELPRMLRAGGRAEFLAGVYWEERWAEDLGELRRRLRVPVA
jgi:ubiquinone biosynthesis protein COQ4